MFTDISNLILKMKKIMMEYTTKKPNSAQFFFNQGLCAFNLTAVMCNTSLFTKCFKLSTPQSCLSEFIPWAVGGGLVGSLWWSWGQTALAARGCPPLGLGTPRMETSAFLGGELYHLHSNSMSFHPDSTVAACDHCFSSCPAPEEGPWCIFGNILLDNGF